MIFYIIPGAILAVSFFIIIFLVIRKLPNISAINTESIPQEKENQVKNRILVERLQRRYLESLKWIKEIINPLIEGISVWWTEFNQKVTGIEKETLRKSQPLKKIDLKQKISETLKKVEQAMTVQEYEQAEELAIEVLEMDPKNITAFELLGDIYISLKEYKKARETYKYLIRKNTKRNGELQKEADKHLVANYFADMGYVYELEGRNDFAIINYKKAVDLEPSNPRFLDLLLKISIIVKDKNQAKTTYSALKEADPDNQKLQELAEEIEALPDTIPNS